MKNSKFPAMFKPMIHALIAGTIFMLLVAFLTNRITSDLKAEEESMQNYIGARVLVNGDTLTIVDNSIWTGDYTLSNGLEVDEKYILKNWVK